MTGGRSAFVLIVDLLQKQHNCEGNECRHGGGPFDAGRVPAGNQHDRERQNRECIEHEGENQKEGPAFFFEYLTYSFQASGVSCRNGICCSAILADAAGSSAG